ncbi:SWIM zinc finger family protein [Actinomadura namibiensis]|uniref:SWIM-type domain-containing protein n=1 Tax=Actinomadura namibiensis TaxID=182080 RepID=A0A7W3LYF6_ACTNM|nr:SWIM zinc finger family protein [Actinomadura namibiensis]MBA8956645.1 hypothetical protein [Actinomadura namibiensis]
MSSVTYAYAAPSSLTDGLLALETSGGQSTAGPLAHPRFFSGVVTEPAVAATGLLALADVAKARYHRPREGGGMRDPVVTCNGDRLRLESFSSCGGVYARLDVLAGGLDGEVLARGTTNVDVNGPLREALARVGRHDPLHLGVGPDELTVTTLDGAVVEKKVPLPERWIRGFGEVQVIASRLDPVAELPRLHAARLLRSLPRAANARAEIPEHGVELQGPGRLATLHPLLRFARSLRVYAGRDGGSTAWELELPGMRYTLVVSPRPARGFSGEGATLSRLAEADGAADADLVGALLEFDPTIEVGDLADRSGLPTSRVRTALTWLGTAGRVGYDLAEASHFHRELPYDPVPSPRLAAARALVRSGSVRVHGDAAEVTSNGTTKRVHVPTGECTCDWWFDHRGSRGPCKHVLAARMAATAAGTPAVPAPPRHLRGRAR